MTTEQRERQALEATFELAKSEQRAGRKDRAYPLYQRIVAQHPTHHQALFLLSGLDLEAGRWAEAARRLELAARVCPENPTYHSNLGLAYRKLGLADRAGAALVRALQLNPDQVEALFQLGQLVLERGEAGAAARGLSHAAQLRPNSFSIQHTLARALAQAQQFERAIAHFHCALALNPSSADVCLDLLAVLLQLRRLPGAQLMARRAVALDPQRVVAHELLAFVLLEQRRFDEGLAAVTHALASTPGSSRLLDYLGHALRSLGRVDEAVGAYRQALLLNPRDSRVHSSLLFTLAFHPDVSDRQIGEEARAWSAAHERPWRGERRPHRLDRSPTRRLRVGYVSPNFADHCQSFFVLPVLRHHDREQFEIVCYSDLVRADRITAQHRERAQLWRDVLRLDDTALAEQIRRDEIDVLVDLTMHMPNHRLHVFARKPAPVQISWLAYPGTTGVEAIDYRITDPFLEPLIEGSPQGAQGRLVLPHSFWCYDPLTNEPSVSALPALERGYVTFGCLNDLCKVSAATLELWAQVLATVEGSRLLLLAPLGSARERVLEHFARSGIGAERVEFTERLERRAYLAAYRGIDVVLDCLPYNGHTTSLDALWMGVPVVTLVGSTLVGRAGLSQVKNLGLSELVADTPERFVRITAGLSRDLPRLAGLRDSLRARMQASPLMDAARFTRDLEACYRRAWLEHCAGRDGE